MNFLMLDKVSSLSKQLTTDITSVWVFVIVNYLVLNKVSFPCKLLLTNITIVWFLIIVNYRYWFPVFNTVYFLMASSKLPRNSSLLHWITHLFEGFPFSIKKNLKNYTTMHVICLICLFFLIQILPYNSDRSHVYLPLYIWDAHFLYWVI